MRLSLFATLGCCCAMLVGCAAKTQPGADAKGRDEGRIAEGPGPSTDSRIDGPPRDSNKPDASKTPDRAVKPDAQGVGSPALFTVSAFEMDFAQGSNGRYRANGGAWQDFNSWSTAGSNGGWSNAGVYVQTTSAVRTELLSNAFGAGKVLRTWIQKGDQASSSTSAWRR